MSLFANLGTMLGGDANSLSGLGKLIDFDKISSHPIGQMANSYLESQLKRSSGGGLMGEYGLTTRRSEALAPKRKREEKGGFWSGVKRFASSGLGAIGSGLSNYGTIGAAALGVPELSPVVGLAGGLFSSLSKLLG